MIRKISFFILLAFFFLLPFHAFLVTWLNVGLGLDSIWVTLWRELFIAILTILAIVDVILRPRPEAPEGLSNVTLSPALSTVEELSKGDIEPLYTQLKKITLLDWLIAAYFLMGAVFFFYKRESIGQWLLGARYDFEFLYFYWLVRIFGFGKKEIWAFFKSAMTAAAVVVILGWVLYFLPQDFLTKFGYAPYADEWNSGGAVFACHYVEFDQSFCRMQSTFGGPGRYGLYLLFVTITFMSFLTGRSPQATAPDQESLKNAVILSLPTEQAGASVAKQQKAKDLSKIRKLNFFHTEILRSSHALLPQDDNNAFLGRPPTLYRLFWLLFLLLSLGALYLTLSRSAWIGLFGALAVCTIFLIKKLPQWKRILAKSAAVAAIAALIFTFLAPTSFKTIIIRSASTSQHLEAFVKGVQTAVAHPLGIGLGKAGPASVPFEKFLTENAYLQVIVEMGFLGGALFLAILIMFILNLSEHTVISDSTHGALRQRSGQAPRSAFFSLFSRTKQFQESHPILSVPGRRPNLKNTPNFTNFINFPLHLISLLTLISLMLSGLFVHSFEEMSLNLTLFGFIGLITDRKFFLDKN